MATIRQQLRMLDLEGEKEVLVPMDYIIGLLNEIDGQDKSIERWIGRFQKMSDSYDSLLAQSLKPCKCNHKRLDVRG